MSRQINNAYIKIPEGIDALDLIENTRALLSGFDRFERIQYQRGEPWICVYEGGILALRESARIEAFKLLTRKFVDEVVVVGGYSGVCAGSYGHFVEGEFVRFLAQCEDWSESLGEAEPWEAEMLDPVGGLSFLAVLDLGDRLGLPGCGEYRSAWEIDLRCS